MKIEVKTFFTSLRHLIKDVQNVLALNKMLVYMKAASWLRKKMLKMEQVLKGIFSEYCEKEPISQSLLIFISMLLEENLTFD